MDAADSDDIRRTLTGDGDAYRRLVERHQNEIAKRLRKFSRDPRAIEEMTQDVFVQAYFSLSKFRGDSPFIHWLHRIAVRVGYRHWNSSRSAAKISPIDDLPLAAASSARDDSPDLEKVLNQLSPRDRLVVTLMYLEDYSVEETAKLTGWSKTMVKVQSFRARGKLRKMMEEEKKGEPPRRKDAKKEI